MISFLPLLKKNARCIYVVSSLLLIFGCQSHPVSLVPLTSPLAPGTKGTIPAAGSSCQWSVLGLIPLSGVPTTAEALEEAEENAHVESMTDVTIDETYRWFVLMSRVCISVEGMGVKNK